MSKYLYFVLVLTTLCVVHEKSFAQKERIPGYLGMRNYLIVTNYLSFSQQPQTPISYKNYGLVEYGTRVTKKVNATLNKKIEFGYGRALSNRMTMEVLYGSMKTSMEYGGRFFNSKEAAGEILEAYGTPSISGRTIGTKMKFHFRSIGGLAPLGFYFSIKLDYANYTLKNDQVLFDYCLHPMCSSSKHKLNLRSVSEISNTYALINGSASIGIHRILYDRILIDLGSSVGYSLPAEINNQYDDGIDDDLFGKYVILGPMLNRIIDFNLVQGYFSVGLVF